MDIKLIDIGINPFKVGDVMVTSGNGGIYPPNVPVAIIEKLTGDGAIGKLLANPAGTDFVIVQEMYEPELVDPEASGLPPANTEAAAPLSAPRKSEPVKKPAAKVPEPAAPATTPAPGASTTPAQPAGQVQP